jgi:hypothetical protein
MRLVAVFLFASSLIISQEFRATVDGRIMDPAGAPVTGADVTLRNPQTGDVVTTKSGDDGAYHFAFVLPGNYTVTVEKAGFQKQSGKVFGWRSPSAGWWTLRWQ